MAWCCWQNSENGQKERVLFMDGRLNGAAVHGAWTKNDCVASRWAATQSMSIRFE